MAIYKKSVKPVTPGARAPVYLPTDNTRTFDARPKPSDDRRREERARPGQHVDQIVSDPLDDAAADGAED